MSYLTEFPDRPLLAIVGGGTLEPRLKLIDGLLNIVDTLAIGGGLSATFLAAAAATDAAVRVGVPGAGEGENEGRGGEGGGKNGGEGRRRLKKWGKGSAGIPKDSPHVLIAARRLLVKARKRGVEVSYTRSQ